MRRVIVTSVVVILVVQKQLVCCAGELVPGGYFCAAVPGVVEKRAGMRECGG